MTKRNKLIEFKKEKLESLRYSGKREWCFAENFDHKNQSIINYLWKKIVTTVALSNWAKSPHLV